MRKGIYTNTTQVRRLSRRRPARGDLRAGTCMMDYAARELGVDPWDLRRRNFIPPTSSPMTRPRAKPTTWAISPRAGPRRPRPTWPGSTRAAPKARPRASCAAWACATTSKAILGAPRREGRVHRGRRVVIYVGTQSNGQGHETVYAQFLSTRPASRWTAIEIVQGDSDLIAKGGGTGGSRSVTVQGNATLATATAMVRRSPPSCRGDGRGRPRVILRRRDASAAGAPTRRRPCSRRPRWPARPAATTCW